ncbi:hypothetical protein TBLA_0B03500 [Henningerozyma blattae CBS 6284]|uniref:Cap-associated protein CAF20 n=1 Tax=Henningerozyma blattae (strain ATCC 34711 / CBS 6284 / DSM 70876 / NBRC 10599 / NRRL Y-10934 / UCD 77-7) TaxID=1071380 RepID=I2GYI9_HENB6|nr:hypothetical protein TBLA_0B03500 [Tetrapisispora blattae CBS 6284]CCH59191.1 hypothetical protein TBLA_0B03500 [Tetrapisispora blattae CBS 6284]
MIENRYSIEELLQLKPSEIQPVDFDAVEFRAIIEKIKQVQLLKDEEFAHGGHFNRRRSSHHYHNMMKPKIKHNKPKFKTDENGWSTLDTSAKDESSAIEDDEQSSKSKKESSPGSFHEVVKVKPNNKNISSSRPADTKDIVADKQTLNFNAFAALESESDDE